VTIIIDIIEHVALLPLQLLSTLDDQYSVEVHQQQWYQ